MSDKVAVMSRGQIQQIGSPQEIYHQPETAFVATFVGENNQLRGTVERIFDGQATLATPFGELTGRLGPNGPDQGDPAWLFVRPERCTLGPPVNGTPANGSPANAENQVHGRIVRLDFDGPSQICTLQVEDSLIQVIYQHGLHPYSVGDQAQICFRAEDALILSPGETAHD